MALGLRLRTVDTQSGNTLDQVFDRFPVRIGRNELNDLRLDYPFVSQFHAVVEWADGGLVLRDLGSLNGTMVRSRGRVPPNSVIDLAEHDYEFAIVSLLFQAFAVDVDAIVTSRKSAGFAATLESQLGEEPEEPVTAMRGAPRASAPDTSDESRNVRALESACAEFECSKNRLLSQIAELSEETREGFITHMAERFPSILSAISPPPEGKGHTAEQLANTAANARMQPEESMALQGLRELARWFLPGQPPPAGVAEIAVFLQRVQETLEVFLRSFIPLREGYRQFESSMDIRRAEHEGKSLTAQSARTPQELAQLLLDWNDPRPDNARGIESTFADVMIHHVAMLNGVMNGVKSLLSELSPKNIEKLVDDPRRRSSGGIQIGPFRYKQLWELYAERHGDLADEEREAFKLIFGPEFVQAYSQFSGTSRGITGPGMGRAASGFPARMPTPPPPAQPGRPVPPPLVDPRPRMLSETALAPDPDRPFLGPKRP